MPHIYELDFFKMTIYERIDSKHWLFPNVRITLIVLAVKFELENQTLNINKNIMR